MKKAGPMGMIRGALLAYRDWFDQLLPCMIRSIGVIGAYKAFVSYLFSKSWIEWLSLSQREMIVFPSL